MPSSLTAPPPITLPFAQFGNRSDIPTASQIGIADGAASYNDGFPPLTSIPMEAGGKPPTRPDFNGILYALSVQLNYINGGGFQRFNAAMATAIGGYPYGAILQDDAGKNLYQSTVDGNSINFNTTPNSIGSQWRLIAGLDGIPPTRTISTTAPLTGGGDLSGNRTLAISAAGSATATTDGAAGSATYAADNDTTSRNKAATPAGGAAQINSAVPVPGRVLAACVVYSNANLANVFGPVVSSTRTSIGEYRIYITGVKSLSLVYSTIWGSGGVTAHTIDVSPGDGYIDVHTVGTTSGQTAPIDAAYTLMVLNGSL